MTLYELNRKWSWFYTTPDEPYEFIDYVISEANRETASLKARIAELEKENESLRKELKMWHDSYDYHE